MAITVRYTTGGTQHAVQEPPAPTTQSYQGLCAHIEGPRPWVALQTGCPALAHCLLLADGR